MSGFAESRAAFAERFPEIVASLDRAGAVSSSLIDENGSIVDATVNDARLYGGDARGFAARQVEAFMAKPLRLFMERPTNAGLVSPICVRLHDALGEFLLDQGIDEISRQVSEDSPSFLVVFGLGLGHHLEELARRTKSRWLIIAEPIGDFIAHSFQTVDWPSLFAHFEAQGGGIEIVTKLDPGEMVSGIVRSMTAQGIPYVDGSYVFTHYPLWAFAEARNRLYEAVEFAFINRGFFEDELKMMTNAVTNFAAGPFWLIEGRPRLHRPELAAVVGAGPSLDEALPRLHEIRDRIVLFSAGTALRPLLRNGFVPEFHCELENVPATFDAVTEAGKYGDLSQVTLIASATVDPRIPPLFRETIYFFRDSVSSTQILGDRHLPIAGATPTCVNMALSMAAFLGFTDMVLFGADCGIRPDSEDHAKDTVYRDIGVFQKAGDINRRYPVEVEGNFGGIARTNWIYDSCRLMLAEVIQLRCLNVFNASDGAFIPGAVPRVPEAIAPTGPAVDRVAMIAALKRSLSAITPAAIFAETDFAATARQADRLYADLDRLLAKLGRGEPDFAAVYRAVTAFLAKAEKRYGRTASIPSGTLIAVPRIAMFFGFRIVDPAVRGKLFSLFIKEFRIISKKMREETKALFGRLVTTAAGAREPDRAARKHAVSF
ncbi:MAG TPA: 6-hydroxymethylpterin diphosphokinase MptE-like protein [Stellaceae bacterium]|nr:6-hydroxymethylpterin diphosphokinase MptE-like protein [Stellaceae bacterium]